MLRTYGKKPCFLPRKVAHGISTYFQQEGPRRMESRNDIDYGSAGSCGHSTARTRKNRSNDPFYEPHECNRASVSNTDRERHHLQSRCDNISVGNNMNSPRKDDNDRNDYSRYATSPYEHRSKYSQNFDGKRTGPLTWRMIIDDLEQSQQGGQKCCT
jgi:hypothetical protein